MLVSRQYLTGDDTIPIRYSNLLVFEGKIHGYKLDKVRTNTIYLHLVSSQFNFHQPKLQNQLRGYFEDNEVQDEMYAMGAIGGSCWFWRWGGRFAPKLEQAYFTPTIEVGIPWKFSNTPHWTWTSELNPMDQGDRMRLDRSLTWLNSKYSVAAETGISGFAPENMV